MSEMTNVRRFGGSLGIIIPKAVAEAMEDARAIERTHRDVFRELSK